MSVVDVPGHERFVRTMVAGATGIDLFLMAIAADDGVMPQTREHAAVLRALGIDTGVVAVTKADLADPEVAMIEAAELLPGADVVPVSARTGDGLETLRVALDRIAAHVPGRADATRGTRLHIDRVFTIRGAGTVVTGTLWSGAIERGDELRVLPGDRTVRVRGVQVHDTAVERAEAGQRVAVNLVGVAVSELARGDVLSSPQADLRPAYLLDGEFLFDAEEPEHGDRVQVHHGTRESPARLAWLGGPFWQVRLEQPLMATAWRPARDPADRSAGHARGRRRARSRTAQAWSEPRVARPAAAAGPRGGAGDGGRRAATRGRTERCPDE